MSQAWPEEKEQDWPQPTPEAIKRALAAPPTRADRFAPYFLGAIFLLSWMLPLLIIALAPLIERVLSSEPVTAVPIEGYHLSYLPTITHCAPKTPCGRSDYYMGRAADGRCLTLRYPGGWDPSMCSIRLRQIEANDCRVVPDNDDNFCHQMLADLKQPGAIRERARTTVYMQGGKVAY